jgi:hypothetical protein
MYNAHSMLFSSHTQEAEHSTGARHDKEKIVKGRKSPI